MPKFRAESGWVCSDCGYCNHLGKRNCDRCRELRLKHRPKKEQDPHKYVPYTGDGLGVESPGKCIHCLGRVINGPDGHNMKCPTLKRQSQPKHFMMNDISDRNYEAKNAFKVDGIPITVHKHMERCWVSVDDFVDLLNKYNALKHKYQAKG